MGGEVPISYYVPPACDPALGREVPGALLPARHRRLLPGGHRRQGDGRQRMGPRPHRGTVPSIPGPAAEPWTLGESTWVAKPALDFIIVSPHGRTLPGGRGPRPDLDTGLVRLEPAVRP